MRLPVCLLLIALLPGSTLLSGSCARTPKHAASGSDTLRTVFPLPDLPAALNTPEARAGYLVEHYWEKWDFRRRPTAAEKDVLEQAFANYLYALPLATKETKGKSIRQLMQLAAAGDSSLLFFIKMSEKYLYEVGSPMHDEDTYLLFLQATARLPHLDTAQRERTAYRLQTVRKNRPGDPATDFRFRDRHGRTLSLRQTITRRTLLLFYDPDCEHCRQTLTEMDDLTRRLAMPVIAIYAEGDTALFGRTKDQLPARWTVGIDITGIRENTLYDLKAMPTLYVIGKDGRVEIKDATTDEIAGE